MISTEMYNNIVLYTRDVLCDDDRNTKAKTSFVTDGNAIRSLIAREAIDDVR